MSEKKTILSALLRLELLPGNHSFEQLLTTLAISHLGKDPIDAERFAERNLRKYWNWFLAFTDDHKERGLSPYFLIPSGSSYSVACASYDLSMSHDSGSQLRGRDLLTRAALLNQLDALDDRTYEALAGVVCEVIGVDRFVLTPPGNEGGIDFFAHVIVRKSSSAFPVLGTRLRVVGQCKKYASALTVDKFDPFIQTMHNVRYRSDRVRSHIPSWFNESAAPIVGWIIGHSGFQTGTTDEGKQHGFYMSDSVDLAEILCQGSNGDSVRVTDYIHSKCKKYL